MALAGPQDFMSAPARWVEWMSHYGGTATAGPNFSYALSARALRRLTGLDLSRGGIALNGAEPVDPATVEAFCSAGAAAWPRPRRGLPRLRHGRGHHRRYLPRAGGRSARPTSSTGGSSSPTGMPRPAWKGRVRVALALLGRPVGDLQIRICEPHSGALMSEREVGELQIRGTSVTPGYYKRPEATAAAFDGEWLKTGDLAYLVDGELVVCGRLKDVIIVGGRNVFPEDVERAAASVEGVRAGNVIAFGVEGRRGREAVVVVAETRADDPHPVRQAVVARVLDAVGLPPEEVVLVPPGSLPKTSSGKLQRSLCRARYLEASLTSV